MTFFAQWELLTEKGYQPYLVMDWRKANKYRNKHTKKTEVRKGVGPGKRVTLPAITKG